MLGIFSLVSFNKANGITNVGLKHADINGPEISLLYVDQAYLDNPTQGTSELWPCGFEYSTNYQGDGVAEDIIVVIKNEGDATLEIENPIFLAPGTGSSFSITQFPATYSIPAGGMTHFVVRYTGPAIFSVEQAGIVINSNDDDEGLCGFLINFKGLGGVGGGGIGGGGGLGGLLS